MRFRPQAIPLRTIFMAAALVAVGIAAVFFMNIIFDLRVRELRQSLRNLNNNQVSFRTLALISRYQLIRDRMARSDDTGQLSNEGKTMLAMNQTMRIDEQENPTIPDRMAIVAVNALNWVTGSEPFRDQQSSIEQKTLELAYLYEIRRGYAKAVETYDLALKMIPAGNEEARQYAYLHRGFCLSLLDKKNEALIDYSIVISSNQSGEFRYTAEMLSIMLGELLKRSTRIDAMQDSEDKAEAYFKLAAYPKALSVYDNLQKKGTLSARANYYAGRVFEETGQTEKAAEKFRTLISTDTNSAWALKANRRIYALGAFYGGDKKYREESQKNAATVVKDSELTKTAAKFEAIVKKTEEDDQRRKANITETENLVEKEKINLEPAKSDSVAKPPEIPAAPITPPPTAATPAAKPPKPVSIERKVPEAKKELSDADKLRTMLENRNITRVERKSLLMTFKEIELITIEDGNKLWGIPVNEDDERVSFFTVMGKVNIAKSRIANREKFSGDQAFK